MFAVEDCGAGSAGQSYITMLLPLGSRTSFEPQCAMWEVCVMGATRDGVSALGVVCHVCGLLDLINNDVSNGCYSTTPLRIAQTLLSEKCRTRHTSIHVCHTRGPLSRTAHYLRFVQTAVREESVSRLRWSAVHSYPVGQVQPRASEEVRQKDGDRHDRRNSDSASFLG